MPRPPLVFLLGELCLRKLLEKDQRRWSGAARGYIRWPPVRKKVAIPISVVGTQSQSFTGYQTASQHRMCCIDIVCSVNNWT